MVLSFNRYEGVKAGKSYLFETRVTPTSDQIAQADSQQADVTSTLDKGIHQIHQLASHTADTSRQALDGITLLVERLQNLSRLINQFHD